METPKVQFNTKSENIFYGMQNTLQIFQTASKGMNISTSQMEGAWSESDTPEKRAVVLSILFSIGDITARQHNIFDGKVESGGNAQRVVFRDVIVPFVAAKVRSYNKPVRLQLIKLVSEYTVMDNIFATRVQTKTKTNKVQKVINMVEVFGLNDVASYAANIILKGTDFEKICLAKFLTRPRFSKRSKNKTILPETIEVMSIRSTLLQKVSKLAKLPFTDKGTYIDFEGYYKWRRQYNGAFESVVFSTGAIKDFDKEQFIAFVDKLPSDARFRVRNRVLFNEKWVQLKDWYTEWEKFKETKQTEQRELETMFDNGTATEADMKKLQKVKKEAKVNTGAVSFTKMFGDIVNGTVDKIKVQPFLDKVKLPYNTLVFCDDSGSMNGGWYSSSEYPFTARQFAAFMATIVLSKNPDPDARDIVGLFSNTLRMFNGVSRGLERPNSLMVGRETRHLNKPLVDSNKHFLENLTNFKGFLDAESTGNGTNVSSIPEYLNSWIDGHSDRLEQIQKYPVWTLISDGNFNNLRNASSSMNDFLRKCENWFGYRPFIILIDVAGSSSQRIEQFSGIDNVMMVPPNPAAIEMLLTNFRDMDVFDVYTPLQSVFRSNRYAPVREFAKKLV